MSSMNGGEFFRFILECWHSFTTLSISFHVFSSVRLSMEAFGDVMASANAPCNFINIEARFLGCIIRFVLDDIMTYKHINGYEQSGGGSQLVTITEPSSLDLHTNHIVWRHRQRRNVGRRSAAKRVDTKKRSCRTFYTQLQWPKQPTTMVAS